MVLVALSRRWVRRWRLMGDLSAYGRAADGQAPLCTYGGWLTPGGCEICGRGLGDGCEMASEYGQRLNRCANYPRGFVILWKQALAEAQRDSGP